MRYIDADALIEDIQETICAKCGDISDGIKCKSCGMDDTLDFLEKAPTADVVPKSEVEELKKAYANYEETTGLKQAKTEVAREIFDDIANMMVLQHGFNEKHIVAHIDFELLKELKKKYTEEKE